MGLVIYCADIGSVPLGRFTWARSMRCEDIDARPDGGIDIAGLIDAVAADLASHHPVALGFECPLIVPVPELPDRLGTTRETDKRPKRGGMRHTRGAPSDNTQCSTPGSYLTGRPRLGSAVGSQRQGRRAHVACSPPGGG